MTIKEVEEKAGDAFTKWINDHIPYVLTKSEMALFKNCFMDGALFATKLYKEVV